MPEAERPTRISAAVSALGLTATRLEWTEALGPEIQAWLRWMSPDPAEATSARCPEDRWDCRRTFVPPEVAGETWKAVCDRDRRPCATRSLRAEDIGALTLRWADLAAAIAEVLKFVGPPLPGDSGWRGLGRRRSAAGYDSWVLLTSDEPAVGLLQLASRKEDANRRFLVVLTSHQLQLAVGAGSDVAAEVYLLEDLINVTLNGGATLTPAEPTDEPPPAALRPKSSGIASVAGGSPALMPDIQPDRVLGSFPHPFDVIDLTGADVRAWPAGSAAPARTGRHGLLSAARALAGVGAGGVNAATLAKAIGDGVVPETARDYTGRLIAFLRASGGGLGTIFEKSTTRTDWRVKRRGPEGPPYIILMRPR